MPARYVHELFYKALINYYNKDLDDKMDRAWKELGVNHRSVGHSVAEILLLSLTTQGDPKKNLLQGLLHLTLDNIATKVKSDLMKKGYDQKTAEKLAYYYVKYVLLRKPPKPPGRPRGSHG